MDKRRLRITSRVLEAVKVNFPETIQIHWGLSRARVFKTKCISWWGNFSFYKPRSKYVAQKNIFYSAVLGFKAERFSLHLTKYAKRYSMRLNSLNHIYLRVIWI